MLRSIMNLTGLFIAIVTFFAIGLGFLWVIKLEYFVGAHVAKRVAVIGIVLTAASVIIPSFWGSAIIGVIGGTIIWGATELPDQQKRVAAGQFPKNPKKGGVQ
ncbi:MAG: DUF4491 family protein [Deltaproteobacteria bacterium]|nr:DUF4491 family protein [Deltaproteobacteria bacterium]MBN2674288.1 DUF4491 family protein [Deltaproteobacteria bacterium]